MTRHKLLNEPIGLTLINGSKCIGRSSIMGTVERFVSVADEDAFVNMGDPTIWFIILKNPLFEKKFQEIENYRCANKYS